ncbi:hypothetical protein GCM10023216_15330 [Isoptericola chiayiensis]|uniref:BD-FAE-like domain-containing protein n=1 Tax=Isoptericola chiayiensis TaxID=579446 RepID=A0ABP8YCP8_9MICO
MGPVNPPTGRGARTAPAPPAAEPPRRSLVVAVLAVVALVLLVPASGALVPQVPGWGHLGAAASSRAVWLAVGGLAVLLAGTAALLRRASATRLGVVLAGAATVVCALTVLTQQLLVAQEHGVAVRIGELFAVERPVRPPDRDAVYARFDGRPLDLSVWEPASGGSGAPVVVLVHGGGWVTGDRRRPGTAAHAGWFADQGYVAVSVDYPLSGDDEHRWDVVEPQVACALVWVARHAAEHGGEPGRVFLVGDSAGGNVALDVAYRARAGTLEPACDGDVPEVAAVSTLYPVADPAGLHDNPDPLVGADARTMAERYTGGSPAEVPQRYDAVTPATHVTPSSPPTVTVTGAADHLVPPQGAADLAATLAAHDVDHQHVEIPAAGHVVDAAPGGVGTQVWRELTLRLFATS